MENYIVINGKKAELTEEQLEQLGIEVEKPNPYERVNEGEVYYSCEITGSNSATELKTKFDDELYINADYCADKEMAEQDILHDLLNRKLRQFSNLNGGIELNSNINKYYWEMSRVAKYYIFYNYTDREFYVNGNCSSKTSNVVYFKSQEIAERAIEEIIKPFMKENPEFVW